MENRRVSMAFLRWTGIGVCAVLVAIAALAPAGASAALIVPHAEPPRAAPITPHAVEPAPAGIAPASPSPATPAAPSSSQPSSAGSSGGAASAAPASSTQAAPSPAPAQSSPGDLEADARHHFAGTPDFYARDPVGLIFQVLPMSPPLGDQVHAYIDEQRDLLATTDDLATYLEVTGKIMDAEEILAYIDGWEPTLSIDVEAEARHRFAGTPDFYQRNPTGAIFSALPTVDQVTSIVDQLRGNLAANSYNNDPDAYFAELRNLARVEEIVGRLEEAHEAQGLLETRAILGYSEVGDRECPYMDFAFINNADLRNTGAC